MHLRYIDALRGIAILMVIVVHAATLSGLTGRPIMLAFAGQRGVQLFYLISALTLFHSLDRLKREDRPYFRYALRRFFGSRPCFTSP